MSIPALAAELAARIPELSRDSVINNAIWIQELLQRELEQRDQLLLTAWKHKFHIVMERLERIQSYASVAGKMKPLDFDTFQMMEANLAEIHKITSQLLIGYKET